MIYLLATLFLLGFLHYVYETIVAPSLRMSARHRLLVLRDELRRLKMGADDELDDRHFQYLQDSLNVLIQTLDTINLSFLIRLQNLSREDAAFRQRVEERLRVLDDCTVPQVLAIRRKSVRIALEAFTINCGGGIIYFVPLLVVVSGYSRVKRLALALTSMSTGDLPSIERQSVVSATGRL